MKKVEHLKRKKNILYTGFGDKGTTTLFNCQQNRISKSAKIIEALGSVDELNAYLGKVKVLASNQKVSLKINKKDVSLDFLIEEVQQALFIIQAEIGGSKMSLSKKDLIFLEKTIEEISDILPPIKSFTLSGGNLLSSELDYARALTRRVERAVIIVAEEKKRKLSFKTISYLNRLSSLFFAMSRYVNYLSDISEKHPKYNKK
jgi:cob(I)alamin adenosyltransferase